MLPRDPNFTRIPVTARGVGGTATYWLGPDHLLVVEVHGSQERYRRFYYRDIQVLTVRANHWGKVGNAVCGVVLAPCLLLLLAIALGVESLNIPRDDVFVMIFWAIPALFSLVCLVANLWLGRTCSCQLRTAVQAEELPGLNRLRAARKVMAQLSERVLQVQGPLSPTDLAGTAAAAAAAPPVAVMSRATRTVSAMHNAGYLGRYHRILCWLLLVLAGLSLVDLFWRDDVLDWVSLAAILAALVINILALVRQYGSRLPERLRWLAWAVLAFHLAMLGVAIGYAIFVNIKHPELMDVHESPWDNPLLLGMDFASIIVGGLAGVAGLLMLASFRHEILTPPPLVPLPLAPADRSHLDTAPGAPASGPAEGESFSQHAGSETGAPPLPPPPPGRP